MIAMKETIAAIATAPGRGGVAVVRISGDGAFEVGKALTGKAVRRGRIMVRYVMDEECVVLAFKSPHSYTGEDVVEIQCHGGMMAPRRILDAALLNGARLARRGEFTERAFLNGRISYRQAEAVIELIDAKTELAARSALMGLSGILEQTLRRSYNTLIKTSANIEHMLDIDEADIPDALSKSMHDLIQGHIEGLDGHVKLLRRRSIMHQGALVVLAGAPNAGKSSLFNALVEENRAIVSPTAGTTRDAIESWLDLEGWPVRIVDTAGIRDASDSIESEGVRRTGEYLARADVILALDDTVEIPPGSHARIVRLSPKCDIERGDALNVSAKTGEGLEALRNTIVDTLEEMSEADNGESGWGGDDAAIAAIMEAISHLRSALDAGDDLVLMGNAVRRAAETLGRQIGAEYSSDMLDRLFSRFCVGK